jgi:hypothetical protein
MPLDVSTVAAPLQASASVTAPESAAIAIAVVVIFYALLGH